MRRIPYLVVAIGVVLATASWLTWKPCLDGVLASCYDLLNRRPWELAVPQPGPFRCSLARWGSSLAMPGRVGCSWTGVDHSCDACPRPGVPCRRPEFGGREPRDRHHLRTDSDLCRGSLRGAERSGPTQAGQRNDTLRSADSVTLRARPGLDLDVRPLIVNFLPRSGAVANTVEGSEVDSAALGRSVRAATRTRGDPECVQSMPEGDHWPLLSQVVWPVMVDPL